MRKHRVSAVCGVSAGTRTYTLVNAVHVVDCAKEKRRQRRTLRIERRREAGSLRAASAPAILLPASQRRMDVQSSSTQVSLGTMVLPAAKRSPHSSRWCLNSLQTLVLPHAARVIKRASAISLDESQPATGARHHGGEIRGR